MIITLTKEILEIIEAEPSIDARKITKIIFDGNDDKHNMGIVQLNLEVLSKMGEVEKRRNSKGIVEYRIKPIPAG